MSDADSPKTGPIPEHPPTPQETTDSFPSSPTISGPFSSEAVDLRVSDETPIVHASATYFGPLPPPSMLAEFGRIDASFPERIMSQFESEAKHRRRIEQQVVEQNKRAQEIFFKERRIGQIFAVLVVFGVLALAAWMAKIGFGEPAGWIVGTTLVGLAGVFLTGRALDLKEDRESETKKPS